MPRNNEPERYSILIDSLVTTKDELFSRITDIVYLGYSSFSGWDAFYDMFRARLEGDIRVEITNEDLSGLNQKDRSIYLGILQDLQQDRPGKLVVT